VDARLDRLVTTIDVASPGSLRGTVAVGEGGCLATAPQRHLRGDDHRQPAALNGRYELRFLAANRIHLVRNGKVVVVGRTTIVGNRVTFVDLSGLYVCTTSEGKTGIYKYRLAGRRLRSLQTRTAA
jgi:hypothetical protein